MELLTKEVLIEAILELKSKLSRIDLESLDRDYLDGLYDYLFSLPEDILN